MTKDQQLLLANDLFNAAEDGLRQWPASAADYSPEEYGVDRSKFEAMYRHAHQLGGDLAKVLKKRVELAAAAAKKPKAKPAKKGAKKA